MARTGRPRKPIDLEHLKRLAAHNLSVKDCAALMGVGSATLERRLRDDPECREAFDKGRAETKEEIERLVMREARTGNDKVLVHLHKTICGHSEKIKVETSKVQKGADETATARAMADLMGEDWDPEDDTFGYLEDDDGE